MIYADDCRQARKSKRKSDTARSWQGISGIGETACAVWKTDPARDAGLRGTNNVPLVQVAFHAKTGAKTPAVTTNSHESPGRYGAGDAQRLKKT